MIICILKIVFNFNITLKNNNQFSISSDILPFTIYGSYKRTEKNRMFFIIIRKNTNKFSNLKK